MISSEFLGCMVVWGIMFLGAWVIVKISERKNATGKDNR